MDVFNGLKSLNLDTEDDTLKILIRTHTRKELFDACTTLKNDIDNGKDIKSRIKLLRKYLKGGCTLIDQNTIVNKKCMQDLIKEHNLIGIEIKDKYVIHLDSKKDLSLNLDPMEFFTMAHGCFVENRM